MTDTPAEFETIRDARGALIVARVGEHEGRARVFSAGEQDARDRAEAQARAKAAASADS